MNKYLILIIVILILGSCGKTETNQPLIVGKWYFDSVQVKSGATAFSIIFVATGHDYSYDFRDNGKLYIHFINNSYDSTATYSITNQTKGLSYIKISSQLLYGNEIDSILKITSQSLILTSPKGGESLYYMTH